MSNYSSLKSTINANVRTNGNQEITGSVLNSVLTTMVESLGNGYIYKGVASAGSDPGTPDQNVFYIAATPGTYTHFGGLVVSAGEVAILAWNGSWRKEVTGAATQAKLQELSLHVDEQWKLPDQSIGGIAQGYFPTNTNTLPAVRNAGTSFSSAKIEVTEGQVYKIYGNASTNDFYRLWATYNAQGNKVAMMTTSGDYTETPYVLTIPAGVTTIVVNLYNYNSSRDKIILVSEPVNAGWLNNKIDDEITTLSSQFAGVYNLMKPAFKYDQSVSVSWTTGAYYNSSAVLTNQANFSHAELDVTGYRNQPLKIDVHGATTGLVYAHIVDENGNLLQSIQLNLADFAGVYTMPSNAKYFLLSNRHATGSGYVYAGSFDYLQSLSELSPTIGKISIIGDSITEGVGASSTALRYSTLLCNALGATENNLGVAGTLLAGGQTGHTEESRFVARATAANLAGSDLVIVFGGTNDFTYDAKAIGDLFVESDITPSSYIGSKELSAVTDTDTFAGALHELINTIRTNCPYAPILFVTPLNRGNYNAQSPNSKQTNRWGNYLSDFVDAIHRICKFYSIPVCELRNNNLDFSNSAIASQYSVDSLHPNDRGHRLIAEGILKFIMTEFYN